jgi:hypothetical protein
MLRHETDGTARVRPAAAALSGLAGPGVVAEIEECLRIIALNSRPPTASRTGRVTRRGILVSTAVAVAAAVAVLFLLGTFPTAWIGPDPNSERPPKEEPPPKEATSIHELDAEQIAGLLKRGRELIAAGDVSMAMRHAWRAQHCHSQFIPRDSSSSSLAREMRSSVACTASSRS